MLILILLFALCVYIYICILYVIFKRERSGGWVEGEDLCEAVGKMLHGKRHDTGSSCKCKRFA